MCRSAVGRVEWNVTGCVLSRWAPGIADDDWLLTRCVCYRTVLSSAGNDGRVRLWKMTAGNVWRPAGHISVEQAEEVADVDMDGAAQD